MNDAAQIKFTPGTVINRRTSGQESACCAISFSTAAISASRNSIWRIPASMDSRSSNGNSRPESHWRPLTPNRSEHGGLSGGHNPKYRDAWTFYTQLIPQVDRKAITIYAIFAPKRSLANVAGFVRSPADLESSWILAVNPDAPGGRYELADTFIHETMHVLSLAGRQTDFSVSTRHCFVDIGSGCPRRGSYLYAFIKRFWTPLLPQWRRAEKNNTIAAFYEKHAADFTREYAATSPTEDISESFAPYVLDTPGEPSGVVAKEKFFGAYPKLVAIKRYAQQHGVMGLEPSFH